MEVYGFLYLGYTNKKYWWEIAILARKFAILMTLVWINRISVTIQALVALLILFIAVGMHYSNNPFRKNIINRIESLSLFVGLTTVYAGLWYLTGEVDE